MWALHHLIINNTFLALSLTFCSSWVKKEKKCLQHNAVAFRNQSNSLAVFLREIRPDHTKWNTIKWLPFTVERFLISPHIDEISCDHQHGFWHNRSTTDQIFYFCQILEKKWEYSERVHQLLVDLACDSVRRELLHSVLIESGVPVKLVRLI
jgi:hypothetical protein